ncbi:MAG TPA: GNAT family N-acetyltransferase [Jatrophihabitans sp.]|nr:GNAT family N-acetyltransferase [Jatrophihabitans sp.]
MIDVRLADPDDVAGIRAVSRATGQPEIDSGADPRYVRALLEQGRVLVAACDDRICGWGAVRAGALGELLTDLFVAPENQGAGIGRTLLARLWPVAEAGGRLTFSSRHPHAQPLYLRSGLQPRWPLLYLAGRPGRLPAPQARARSVEAGQAAEAEHALVGASRGADYRYWSEGLGAQALVVEADGRLIAAGARLPGRLIHLGCAADASATDALFAALRTVPGTRATVCLPGPHPAVRTMLGAGWRAEDYDLAMTTADVTLPVTWAYSPALG